MSDSTYRVQLALEAAKYTMHDSNPAQTFGYVAEQLGKLGIAYLHVIEPADKEAYKVDGVSFSATKHLKSLFGGTDPSPKNWTQGMLGFLLPERFSDQRRKHEEVIYQRADHRYFAAS